MRRLLQRMRDMPDERKGAFAFLVAGSCTAVILFIWGVSFVDVVAEAEPALAIQKSAGPVSNLMNQIGELFNQTEIEEIFSTSTQEAFFDQAN